jgi:hypothetical protein
MKRKSLNEKYTVWIEFFFLGKPFIFVETFLFSFWGLRMSRFLPSPSRLPFTYFFMKSLYRGPELQRRDACRFSFHLFYVILNFFMYKTGAENPNKASVPSGDVVSLCPTRRSRNMDSSNKLKASYIIFIFHFFFLSLSLSLHLFTVSRSNWFWI